MCTCWVSSTLGMGRCPATHAKAAATGIRGQPSIFSRRNSGYHHRCSTARDYFSCVLSSSLPTCIILADMHGLRGNRDGATSSAGVWCRPAILICGLMMTIPFSTCAQRVIVFGRSIGTGPATNLVSLLNQSNKQATALVLQVIILAPAFQPSNACESLCFRTCQSVSDIQCRSHQRFWCSISCVPC